jgi:hypothetical protein
LSKLTEVSVKNDCKATCNHYRKLVYPLFLNLLVLLLTSPVQAKYSGGTGEPNNPYQIADANDLNEIGTHSEDWDAHFILTADIDLSGFEYTTALIAPDTSSSNGFQGTKFTGVFDGNSHIIFSLDINDSGAGNDYIGLFGYVGIDGQVLNLAVEDVNIKGDDYVGGLIGESDLGTASNCCSTGSISGGNYVGGLVGYNHGTATNCYSSSLVSGTGDYIGGVIGWNDYGIAYNCYSSSLVNGAGSYTGGLIGKDNGGTISNCYSTGIVSGTYVVGGLMGINFGTVTNCYSTGSISGDYKVGGLVGANQGSSISNCYSSGSVSGTGEKVGGLIGANYSPVSNCFWDIQTSGQTIGVGYGSSDGVTGKMTAEMQMRSTFTDAGWDFIDIWDIGENQTYPYLRVYPTGDLNHNGVVNLPDFAIFSDHWLAGVE